MTFAHFDSSKVVAYKELVKSTREGCFNMTLDDGTVFSGAGDTRPAGTDGPWEQGTVSGNIIAYVVDGVPYVWQIAPLGNVQR